MKSIVLEVTLTGATGEVSGIPGAHGHIMSYRINYTGQSGDTADVTLYETVDRIRARRLGCTGAGDGRNGVL